MSAIMIVDEAVNNNCWNPYDSHGEICVHCGCCNKDKRARYMARFELCKRKIEELENFTLWIDDPKWRSIQEKNIKTDLRLFKRLLRYYKKRLRDAET